MKQSGHLNPSEETGCHSLWKDTSKQAWRCGSTTTTVHPCLVQPFGAHGGKVKYFGCFCFRGQIGFMNCDDICMCVVNKQFELLEFVVDAVYVDLQCV